VSLLEDGLCTRIGGRVAFESETLLEYLISLDLPDDPFESLDLEHTRPPDAWWGAAAFKATRLPPERLRSILKVLVAQLWPQEYALSLISRSPDPTQYASVVESMTADFFVLRDALERFLRESLDRRDPEYTRLVLRVVRIYVIHHSGSWREKDWRDTATVQFEARLAKASWTQLGLVVVRAHEVDPATTFDVLADWVEDETYLEDEEAKVTDFASLFLRHLGCRDFPGILAALERLIARRKEMPYGWYNSLRLIVQYVAEYSGHASFETLARWVRSDRQVLRMLAMELVPAIHARHTREMLETLREYAQRHDIPEGERAVPIESIGKSATRASLDALAEMASREEYQAGVVAAYRRLFPKFPLEVTRRLVAFNKITPLRRDVIDALNGLYRNLLPTCPDAAIGFFHKLQQEHPGQYTKDIAYSIHSLTKSISVVTDFVSDQLQIETSGNALELYHYYLRHVRLMNDSDVPWVRRWIESGDSTYGLLAFLLNGDASYENKAELYVRLDAVGPLYSNNSHGLENNGAKFVDRFHRDARFLQLTEDGKIWITEIVSGRTVWQAATAIKDARLKKAYDRLKRGKKDNEQE
jgi:hypothetical protein